MAGSQQPGAAHPHRIYQIVARLGRQCGVTAYPHLEHLAAATALNVIRLDAWYTSRPIDRARTTHLQRIDLAPAA